jgi:AMP-polyphosphate phosphotransferase
VGRLDELDLSKRLSREEEAKRLEAGQKRLLELRLRLGGKLGGTELGPPVCVVFEGWDASGKGGAIKRLVARLDPRHVRVAQFAAPTHDERRHHFLWRFWPALPGLGGMAVLDRSWYGRVLVERVEGFATEEEWRRAYDEIVEFERSLAHEGMVLIKFWLHISADEQLRRFERRARDPLRAWKLTTEDWRNRELRPAYLAVVEEMLERTDRDPARWQLVEAESKRYARVKVVETVIAEIEAAL